MGIQLQNGHNYFAETVPRLLPEFIDLVWANFGGWQG